MGGWIPLQNGQWDGQFQMPTAMVPQIKIGQTVTDAVPTWDGDGTTALQWFASVQEFAGARGGTYPTNSDTTCGHDSSKDQPFEAGSRP